MLSLGDLIVAAVVVERSRGMVRVSFCVRVLISLVLLLVNGSFSLVIPFTFTAHPQDGGFYISFFYTFYTRWWINGCMFMGIFSVACIRRSEYKEDI